VERVSYRHVADGNIKSQEQDGEETVNQRDTEEKYFKPVR